MMLTVFFYALITTEELLFGGTYEYPAAAYSTYISLFMYLNDLPKTSGHESLLIIVLFFSCGNDSSVRRNYIDPYLHHFISLEI